MMNAALDALFDKKRKKNVLVVNVHKIGLHFYCDQKFLIKQVRRYLQYFAERPTGGIRDKTHCCLTIMGEREYDKLRGLYRASKSIEAFPGVMATFGAIDRYCVYEIESSVLIIIDDRTNDCTCVFRRTADKKVFQSDYAVHILMMEWLRARGMFFIHSSGLCRKRDAYIFIGPSGAGKTTTSLMGAQRGLSFMGDDLLIVKENGTGVVVHSYIEDVKFCVDMKSKFQELESMKLTTGAAEKIKFDVNKYFNVKIVDRAVARRIFFLNKGNTLRKLKPQEALPLLMGSSFFYSREDASVRHFDVLCRLIYSVDSYIVGRGYINRHFDSIIAEHMESA